jgi:outer membrane protein assembly factor BamB
MKDIEEWIKNLETEEIKKRAKQKREGLIAPGESVNLFIRNRISRTEEVSDRRQFPFQIHRYVRFAFAALILFIIGLILFLSLYNPPSSGMFMSMVKGKPEITGVKNMHEIVAGLLLKQGYTIETDDISELSFRFSDRAQFTLMGNSGMTLKKIAEKEVSIRLDRGVLCAKTGNGDKKIRYTIVTPDANIFFGSVILVRYVDKKTYVSLKKGSATIQTRDDRVEPIESNLMPGESMVIDNRELHNIYPMPEDLDMMLTEFQHTASLSPQERYSVLTATSEIPDITLVVNGTVYGRFSRRISITLDPGYHTIEMRKKGYESLIEDIEIDAGESIIVPVTLHMELPPPIIQKKEWNRTTLYTYTSKEYPENNSILGFALSEGYAIAVAPTELICFTSRGRLVWKKTYGEKRRLFFDSLPVIFGNKVYISSNYKIVVIDLDTGEETMLDAPGIISDGFRISLYDNTLYFPYSDGIYLFSPEHNMLDPQPAFSVNSPGTPCINTRGLYIPSVISTDLVFIGHDRKFTSHYSLRSVGACTPIVVKDNVFTGDSHGTIYKLTENLEPVKTVDLNARISSIVAGTDDWFFALTSGGTLYMIDIMTLDVRKKIIVDNKSDSGIYLFKHPVVIQEALLIGTGNGSLMTIDPITGDVVKNIKIVDTAVSCSIYATEKKLFTGTVSGAIVMLE